ncbi:MAG: hypothetical protein HRT89_25095, partial [Lentisphaeria bacterium]|nr:hypothetical protein [Lentisphaeria bacterium]
FLKSNGHTPTLKEALAFDINLADVNRQTSKKAKASKYSVEDQAIADYAAAFASKLAVKDANNAKIISLLQFAGKVKPYSKPLLMTLGNMEFGLKPKAYKGEYTGAQLVSKMTKRGLVLAKGNRKDQRLAALYLSLLDKLGKTSNKVIIAISKLKQNGLDVNFQTLISKTEDDEIDDDPEEVAQGNEMKLTLAALRHHFDQKVPYVYLEFTTLVPALTTQATIRATTTVKDDKGKSMRVSTSYARFDPSTRTMKIYVRIFPSTEIKYITAKGNFTYSLAKNVSVNLDFTKTKSIAYKQYGISFTLVDNYRVKVSVLPGAARMVHLRFTGSSSYSSSRDGSRIYNFGQPVVYTKASIQYDENSNAKGENNYTSGRIYIWSPKKYYKTE